MIYTTAVAAALLGVSTRQARQIAENLRLARHGTVRIWRATDIAKALRRRGVGRPKGSNLSPKASARTLKTDLRNRWPTTRFSVVGVRETNWPTYHVSWRGGPTLDEVFEVALRYANIGYTRRVIGVAPDGGDILSGISFLFCFRGTGASDPGLDTTPAGGNG